MKDTITEYIWFVISLFGTLLGLRMMFYLFYSNSGVVYNIIDAVLGGLM